MSKHEREDKLYNAITNLPDELVDEAKTTPMKRPPAYLKWGAVAACALIVVGLAAVLPRMIRNITDGGSQNAGNQPGASNAYAALVPVSYPAGYGFDDFDSWRETRGGNPVDDEFFRTLDGFAFRSASQILTNSEGNANYSPISLYYALALAATGAEGTTADELFALLGVSSTEELSAQSANLYRRLFVNNEIGKLKIANSLWMANDVRWKQPFIQNAAESFYAQVFNVDFADAQTGKAMGQWISEQTNGTLTPDMQVGTDTILSIINTVYFYDEWIDRFSEKETKPNDFQLADGTVVTCDFMNRTSFSAGYAAGDGFLRSTLSTKNASSMIFVLPDEGVSPRDLLADSAKLETALFGGESATGEVVWQIPKFSYGTSFDLKDSLAALGIESAFQNNADFSRITDGMAFISSVKQETHIGIDEKGVEASAYTAIMYAGAALPEGRAEMILDRPFLFAITGPESTILFIGICENPTLD